MGDRARLQGVLALLACLIACAGDASRVSIDLIHADTLAPGTVFRRLTLTVRDASTRAEVVTRTVSSSAIRRDAELIDLSDLEVGRRYVLSLSAQTDGVCRGNRAAGRSLPFEHREGEYRVSLQVGCADEISRIPPPLHRGRVGASLATDADGHAWIVGGTDYLRGSPAMFGPGPAPDFAERYDPSTGLFTMHALGVTPGAFPAIAALEGPGAPIVVAGGWLMDVPICNDATAIAASGGANRGDPLQHRRCQPGGVGLRGVGRAAIVGGAFDEVVAANRDADVELFENGRRIAGVRGHAFRLHPAAIPLADGCRALVVGGLFPGAPGPAAEVLHAGGACGGEPRMEPVPSDVDVAAGWSDMSAAYVECATGGGAVYVIGGKNDPMAGVEQALDDVWCFRDARDATGELLRAGRIPQPRRLPAVAAVQGREGTRLLIAGGGGDPDSVVGVHSDALLVPVDGCTCAPIEPAAAVVIPLPFDAMAYVPAAARLGDGSVLLTGAIQIRAEDPGCMGDACAYSLDATDETALFIPDLAP